MPCTGEAEAKPIDAARRAGVSTGTVSNVLNRPAAVSEVRRVAVQEAITALGFTRGGAPWTRRPIGGETGSPPGRSRRPPRDGNRRRRRRSASRAAACQP
ncbi:LacI family DNA-binding transcriptional regulator [Streptomyces angustmyceticus]|uniref:LacI family DNA-binding transcriptional regulator n=1 Tax=Streptomyces angustmyceticus TaxID=285578 RepID=UPI00344FADCB